MSKEKHKTNFFPEQIRSKVLFFWLKSKVSFSFQKIIHPIEIKWLLRNVKYGFDEDCIDDVC